VLCKFCLTTEAVSITPKWNTPCSVRALPSHRFTPLSSHSLSLTMPPEEVYKSDISVPHPFCHEVDFLFYCGTVISTQAISWPSHYNYMISFGKAFTKIPQVLSNSMRCVQLKTTMLSGSICPFSRLCLIPSN
jgi:hypothetical protein